MSNRVKDNEIKLCEMIVLVLLILTKYFLLGWECLILGKGIEKYGQNWKMPYFPGFRGAVFQIVPGALEYPQSHISDLQKHSSSLKILTKIFSFNFQHFIFLLIFQQFSDCFPSFAPLLLPILRQFLKFVFFSQCIK